MYLPRPLHSYIKLCHFKAPALTDARQTTCCAVVRLGLVEHNCDGKTCTDSRRGNVVVRAVRAVDRARGNSVHLCMSVEVVHLLVHPERIQDHFSQT
jgi:hypothetical protein